MSDHDFEKRVKQKMDELKFTPSDAVWQAVQLKIRKDRPRRRGWVLIPVLLGGLGVAGFFLFNNINKSDSDISYQSTNSTKSIPQPSDNSSEADSISAPYNLSPSGNSSPIENSSASDNSSQSDNSSETNNSSPSENSSVTKETNNFNEETGNVHTLNSETSKKTSQKARGENIEPQKRINPATDPSGSITNDKKPGSDITKSQTQNKSKQKPQTEPQAKMGAGLQTQPPVQTQAQTKQQSSGIDNFDSTGQTAIVGDQQQIIQPDSILAEMPTLKSDLKNDSSAAEIKDLVKSRKKKTGWGWGLNIAGGVSNINDGPLSGVLKSSHMADAASSPLASNNFLFAPSTVGLPPAKPSEVKAGPYFSIGGFVTKQLSKTFSISAGLQYSQYNTIIEVGYRVDSSRLVNSGSQIRNVARYYRADDNSKFSNKYHFIELPLTLHTRITGSKALPLFWNAGVHLSQMIGSNALVFDSGTGVYYKDKSTLNKTQVGFATGFTVGLFGKSKTPMLIGPSVKYNASEMFKKDILSGKHLISAGLDLRVLLNKK